MVDVFKSRGEKDFEISNDFNIPILNVLWQIATNSRFSREDPKDMERMNIMNKIFSLGNNFPLIPYWLNTYFPSFNGFGERTEAWEETRDYIYSLEVQRKCSEEVRSL